MCCTCKVVILLTKPIVFFDVLVADASSGLKLPSKDVQESIVRALCTTKRLVFFEKID